MEIGLTLRAAAERAGVSERTLRRWVERGREEVDALSEQARLVLALDRAMTRRRQTLDWRAAAARVEANAAWWSVSGDDDPDFAA